MLKISQLDDWYPKIVKTIAINNIGLDELIKEIHNHFQYLGESNQINVKIDKRYKRNIKRSLKYGFEEKFWTNKRIKYLEKEMQKNISTRKNIHEIIKLLKQL